MIQFIGLDQLVESKTNPRKKYDEKSLGDLAGSIKAKGVVQNLVVRPMTQTPSSAQNADTPPLKGGESIYEIVAGSRRCRSPACS